jgi:hypothetical protein
VSKVRIVKRKERKTFLDESGYMGQWRVCEVGHRDWSMSAERFVTSAP